MIFTAIGSNAVSSSSEFLQYSGVSSISSRAFNLPGAVTSTEMSIIITSDSGKTSDTSVKTGSTIQWGAEANRRFKELSREEALRELSIEEQAELEELSRLRRYEKYPRTAEEILWERRQEKVTNGLLQALTDYVHFHETPRNA